MYHNMTIAEIDAAIAEWALGQAPLDELQAFACVPTEGTADPNEAQAEALSALPSLEEQVLHYYDDPTDESIPFAVAIEGHRLTPVLPYDDAGVWCHILAGHFPNSEVGIVLA